MASSLYKSNTSAILPTSAASTNATSVSDVPVDLFSISIYNGNAAVRYLKIYDKSSSPTVGTDTPSLIIPLPPSQLTRLDWAKGHYLSLGLAYALTTGAANSDTGAVGTDITGLTITYSV